MQICEHCAIENIMCHLKYRPTQLICWKKYSEYVFNFAKCHHVFHVRESKTCYFHTKPYLLQYTQVKLIFLCVVDFTLGKICISRFLKKQFKNIISLSNAVLFYTFWGYYFMNLNKYLITCKLLLFTKMKSKDIERKYSQVNFVATVPVSNLHAL